MLDERINEILAFAEEQNPAVRSVLLECCHALRKARVEFLMQKAAAEDLEALYFELIGQGYDPSGANAQKAIELGYAVREQED